MESKDAKADRLFEKFAAEAGLAAATVAFADAVSEWCSLRERGVVGRRLVVTELAMLDAKARRSDIINRAWIAANEWAKTDAEPTFK